MNKIYSEKHPEGVLRSKLSFLEDKSQIWSNSFEPEAIKVNDES